MYLEIEEFLEDTHGVLRSGDGVASCPRVGVNLVVVAALECLVAKEVNGLVGDTVRLLGLVLKVLEAVSLIPPGGEHIEGDLATNGEAFQRMSETRACHGGLGVITYVRPRWPNRSLRTATNFSRTFASLSNASK